ncbi:cell division protein FtsZ [Natrinema sp. 1APR25-10V2]|uniref:cell division protein FtsZ n=1 Tax=Natrinema sp. 1APR25-10V2 TaxID=2951081 RepID=UPI0028763123|nr:cell division protein FtsZ [Natrinema sp. 1APR25-10V2]MDS0476400.1 cell division protein FtsZ [Natrinema sp. 1APR25-10V2]
MQLAVIGVGGAGCRIASAIRAADPTTDSFVEAVFAFDTDGDALAALDDVSDPHRYRYGPDGDDGLEGDLERGLECGREHADELVEVLDRGAPAAADAILVAVGLGGTTGGGTVPPLVATLQRRYDAPVYVLGTLPADGEFVPADVGSAGTEHRSPTTGSDGDPDTPETPPRPRAPANAVDALERLDGRADAVVCFDNERWLRTGERIAEGRDRCNRELATRVAAVFAAANSNSEGAERGIDADDIGRVMGSTTDIVTIGYGEQAVDTGGSRFGLGLFSSDQTVERTSAVSAVETVTRNGIHGKLTLECEREAAGRAHLIVGGPPAWLDRQAIADARRTLEDAVGGARTLGGTVSRPDGDAVFATVVLADVAPVDRLEELRAAADRSA